MYQDKKELQEAWRHFLDNSYSNDDIVLILESLEEEIGFQEFYEASNRVWDWSKTHCLPESEEQKEAFRREAAQLIAEWERKRTMQTIRTAKTPKAAKNTLFANFRKIRYAAAAAVLLGLLIPAVAYLYFTRPKTELAVAEQYLEETTERGETKIIVLSDKTKVTLNAQSRLRYPVEFIGNERQVELFGEALFEVAPEQEKTFTVATDKMKINVLGTVFNIKDYYDGLISSVTVVSGKVEVELPGGLLELEKNQQVKLDNITGELEKIAIDAERYVSWTEGKLYFQRTPIREVVNILNRNFPQWEIELAEGEYSNLISGEHDKNPIEVLTSIIFTTGLKYKQTGNKIILYK